MKAAILGYEQAGKRSLFTLLTGREVPPSRKEHEAIEGAATVADPRVDALARLARPKRIRYAETMLVLCPDVPLEGKGAWIETARGCDLLLVVVRAFHAPEVFHPRGSVDPERDRSDLATEILFADVDLVDKRLERLAKEKRGGLAPLQQAEEHALRKCQEALAKGVWLKDASLDENDAKALRNLGFLTQKPVLWVYNVDEEGVRAVREKVHDDPTVFIVSARMEREIMAIEDPAERRAFLESLGFDRPGHERLAAAAYDALGLMSFYTVGPDEVRAWTIRKGSLAPTAAGKVHTDMERGFIRVEIIRYDDLIEAGSEAEARARGKLQIRGRDYVIQDGDICHFRFSV